MVKCLKQIYQDLWFFQAVLKVKFIKADCFEYPFFLHEMSTDTYLFVSLFAFEHFFQIIFFKTVRRTGFGQSSQRIGEVIQGTF